MQPHALRIFHARLRTYCDLDASHLFSIHSLGDRGDAKALLGGTAAVADQKAFAGARCNGLGQLAERDCIAVDGNDDIARPQARLFRRAAAGDCAELRQRKWLPELEAHAAEELGGLGKLEALLRIVNRDSCAARVAPAPLKDEGGGPVSAHGVEQAEHDI